MKRWLRYLTCVTLLFGAMVGWSDSHNSWAKQTQRLSPNDVVVLLQVGYTEAQVIAQIDKSKMRGKFALTPLQVLKLRKAGASVALIRLMGVKGIPQNTKPKPVSVAELQGWLAQKKPSAWIRTQLKARGVDTSAFGPFAILSLNRAGLPLELLQLIVQLKKQGTKSKPPKPRPTTPISPAIKPIPRRPSKPQPTTHQPPPKNGISSDTLQQMKRRERLVKRRKARAVKRPKDNLYRHIGRHYNIPIPKGWHVYEDVHPDSGQLAVYLTPDAQARPFQMKRGIWLIVEYLPRYDRFTMSRTLQQTGQYILRSLLAREHDLKLTQPLTNTTWQKRKAVQATLQGNMSTSALTLRTHFRLLRHHKALLYAGVFAPPNAHATFAKEANAVLAKLTLRNPNAHRGKRLSKEQSVQSLIKRNTKGVVSISLGVRRKGKLTFRAAGSGFVVTTDGYVLTNWHVVVNMRTKKPYEQYVLNWDQTTKQPSVKARFVGAHYQWPSWKKVRLVDPKTGRISVRFQRQHVDIALLKIIKPGTYPTVSMSAIRHAMLGDSVVAIGFPLEGKGIRDIGNETITATTGRISRMVRMSNQRVNEIQHTAKIAGGNSGGPLLDTATGAVIGINTWVGTFDKRLRRPGMGLGYYYALPIDLGWLYFPDYLEYSQKKLSVIQWLDLGNRWLAANQLKPAVRAYKRCIKLNPRFTPPYMKLVRLHLLRANRHKDDTYQSHLARARRWADRGLKQSPFHTGLMRLLAQLSMRQKQWQTAAFLLRQTMAARPKDWSLYALRSVYYRLQKKPALALKDATKVIKLLGNTLPVGYMLRGMTLYRTKRYFEGRRAYRQALKLTPNSLQAQLGEARGYTLLNQHTDALQQLKKIAAAHPYEPAVFKQWMMAWLRSRLPQRKQEAWKMFQRLMKSSHLRDTKMDAFSLYFGGALAADVLNPKYRQRVMWGIWGGLLARHTRSAITAQATLRLASIAFRRRSRGLAYALLRILGQQNLQNPRLKRAYAQLKQRIRTAGLHPKELFFLIFHTYPRWSPGLLWRCFQLTPSLISNKTAKFLMRKGVPAQLVLLMWRLSQRRRKRGLRPRTTTPMGKRKQTRPTGRALPRQHSPRLLPHKRAIHKVAQLSFQSLRTGDIDTWMAIHDPKGDQARYRKLFWTFRNSILNRKIAIFPVKKIKIQFRRTAQGIIAHYYFPMRINRRPTKLYYWQFRIRGRRWVIF